MFAEALQGALGLGPSGLPGAGIAPRFAMVFTSRLRAGGSSVIREQLALHYGTANQTWLMPSIPMAINPNSVKFVQTKRITKKDTRDGSVYFHFSNSKGQNNDILTIQFSGSTGNIDLRGSISDENQGTALSLRAPSAAAESGGKLDTGALYKLQVWQNLYLMTREPMLLADNAENTFTITYASALFPLPVDFTGFFAKVLEFEELADKPNSRKYSFDFTVTSTNPPLDQLVAEMDSVIGVPPSSVSTPKVVTVDDAQALVLRTVA